ncbi:MAG TPA: T9SS type A sorting domain-containing protein [Candidatus Syntrophosphaera sp.]|nr:T9SS type A sorting domain-containing protein [Candidatus Syntrophosphaera sp.]
MKKLLLVVLALSFLLSLALAREPRPADNLKPLDSPQGISIPQNRDVPEYTFTKLPTAIITNYYDYMIGSYNGLPLRTIPTSAGGGYFMTYHGRRQPTSTRRAFYSYIDAAGNIVNNNEITSVQNHEGFPAIAVDPVSGKPMYAWHANADTDSELEVQFTSDAFIAGIAGLFNDLVTVFDAPCSITTPGGVTTTDNQFIWPAVTIGPSPVAGKRRVYVGARNYVSHALNGSPSENMYFAYADFNGDDIENGVPLSWTYMSIPEMDTWNHDTVEFRRPAGAILADNAGNLYWAGHHVAMDANDVDIDEGNMDVFVCPNYGQGTWAHYSDYAQMPAWNPNSAPTDTTGYYKDSDSGSIPYGDGDIFFNILNSGHINAVIDADGIIHVPSLWSLNTYNNYYYPALQFVKEYQFDTVNHTFQKKDIYPQKDPDDTYNPCFMPWDQEAPWGVEDGWNYDTTNGYTPMIATAWPFPHWDAAAHTDLMMFHYNGIKFSEPNEQNMMVCVWQDSERARMYNYYSDTDYISYANTPEIWISVSSDAGNYWSEPIIINNVDTQQQFAGLKPMYTYPADKVIFTGMQGQNPVGKIGIMFYNDFTWGSNVNTPAYHPTPDGGETMFMELQIVFPIPVSNNDNTMPAVSTMLLQNFPNPFNPETTVSFDLPQAGPANLSIYNVKGQLVKTLANSSLGFGRHSYVWNGTDNSGSSVSSGMYFYRLTANGQTESRKMMLLK